MRKDAVYRMRVLPAIDVVKADPADNVYLATALAGGARCVVTGNTRHLTPHDGYAGLRIAVPAIAPSGGIAPEAEIDIIQMCV